MVRLPLVVAIGPSGHAYMLASDALCQVPRPLDTPWQ
jgi:hypothetical protein